MSIRAENAPEHFREHRAATSTGEHVPANAHNLMDEEGKTVDRRVRIDAARLEGILGRVRAEVCRAMSRHPTLNTPHEGYSVILEELEELWAEIKANRGRDDSAVEEAEQVAAMAIRYLYDLTHPTDSSP